MVAAEWAGQENGRISGHRGGLQPLRSVFVGLDMHQVGILFYV